MKTLLPIFTLVFTVTFSTTSFGAWKNVGEGTGDSNSGDTFYVDFERIRKHGEYFYWWDLVNYLKPTENGRLSSKSYKQGNCKLFRMKYLRHVHYNQPMGRGAGDSNSPKNPEWNYPSPNSYNQYILKKVCSRWVKQH